MKQDLEKWRATQRRSMIRAAKNQRKRKLEKLKTGTLYPKRKYQVRDISKIKINKVSEDRDITWYKKTLWRWFSKFIRLRDSNKNGICACITCGRKHIWNGGDMQAGHYIPAGRGNAVKYNEKNVNGQCVYCNFYLSANLSKYIIAIDKKWGKGTANRLEKESTKTKTFTEQELIGMINEYKVKVKQLLLTKVI